MSARLPPTRSRLSASVIALGVVSLFTDVSSEMIYPLLPVFLTGTLGATAAFLGVIEGAAEATAALLKLWSGRLSDRLARRKRLIVAGYFLSSASRPLVALATAGWHVLAVRLTDRVGKGIRSAPRDALIADVTDPAIRGRAYGLHRALDNTGAVLGPLVAFALLTYADQSLRRVFWWAAVPAAIAMLILVTCVHEAPRPVPSTPPRSVLGDLGPLPPSFKRYLLVLLLFTLSTSSDAFLLLRASQLGIAAASIPLLWAAMNAIRAVGALLGGTLSDRFGRRPLIAAGWSVSAVTYVGFALATTATQAWMLLIGYGLFYSLTEGAEKALVADVVPAAARGAAFGWFNLTLAIGALPASLIFGLVWTQWSPRVAFAMGAALALAAVVALVVWRPRAETPLAPAS